MKESYKFKEFENEMFDFWRMRKIHAKANEKNKGKPKFYFCDGPPYTSGKVHLGTAWNKSLKDSILRYKRMKGFEVLDRAGYDMHGLPTENATERELKVNGKDQIEKYGVDKFVKSCKDLSIRNMKIMNKDFQRMGVWMDFEGAYQSVSKEYISGEWWLVKRANEEGRLYEGYRAMAWDWANQTALAKHELEYQNVTDKSIFVKMKVKGKEDEYLIIWTTTPWTIAFNLGIMANPELDYVKCKVGKEKWIAAKALASIFISSVVGKKFEIIDEFKGIKLEGMEYEHPFYDELKEHYDNIKKKHPKAHTVVLSKEYVDTKAGSGLVHMAPGCGPEDYEVGHANDIPAWNTVKEDGSYSDDMGIFSGRHTLKDNHSFSKDLDKKGALIAETEVEHQYPYGQRSHEPVIFRTTKQWFFKVEDIKQKMIDENNEVEWVPKAGYNAFNSWLENLRDNSISKQRFWGTPLPVWRNDDDPDDYIVIGSVEELEELSGQKVEEPHIPWIDDIKIEKEGKTYTRVPDILDVWVDAGTSSWNSLDFPAREDYFKKYFPCDFILEGKDQIRGWFNLLHVASMVALKKRCFNAVYMHGFINDSMGRKMSKSDGNYILPEEVIEKYGADTLRYYLITAANPGVDLNYNFDDANVKFRNLNVLWNLHNYLLDLAQDIDFNSEEMQNLEMTFSLEEEYMFSKLNSAIKKITKLYDGYKLNEAPLVAEDLFLSLSRVYIQLVRDKAHDPEGKKYVAYTIYKVLLDVLKLFAPAAPFITEKIYLSLKEKFGLKEESVHLYDWPEFDANLIKGELEHNMDIFSNVVQSILSAREKAGLGLRWPVKDVVIVTKDERIIKAINKVEGLIKKQANFKEVKIRPVLDGIKQAVKADYSQIGPDFGELAPKIIAKLSSESPEAILSHLENEKAYKLKVDGKKVNIVKEHLIITREVPAHLVEKDFRGGFIYLNKERTDELEAEGYSREVMRRVQNQRRKAFLNKIDRISLFIKVDDEMKQMLGSHADQIKEKVGADMLNISTNDPGKDHKFNSKEKVKGHEFELFFDKI